MEKVPDPEDNTTNPSNDEGTTGENETPKLNGTSLKSILKVKSTPVNESLPETDTTVSPVVSPVVSPTSTTTDEVVLVPKPSKPPRKKVHGLTTTTTLSYENPAFETDGNGSSEAGSSDHHFVDVVDKVVASRHDEHDWHPFGRTSMYEEVLSGKHKSGLFESEKIILWFIFTILLVGMAGGIIFLSETYSFSGATETTTIVPCNLTM